MKDCQYSSATLQLNFVQNIILVIGQICDANFHLFGDVRDDTVTSGMTSQEVKIFATGKHGNSSNRIFCDLARYMIYMYISGYKHTMV